ncbi:MULTISPECIES: hypothetical protein [Streptomyces]|uniref:hypothetical protein n=1 Tax=Streptomyces TaxID=1883 RepID=UPI002D21E782|nr:hypothetical protein [Streptomyces sp. NRRL F-5702]
MRLSVDEEVHRLHGRYGVDYHDHTYFERERPVVEAIRERFTKEIEAGNDVVLDHGLWRREDLDAWRPPSGGLPSRRSAGTAQAPYRAQSARGCQRPHCHSRSPRRLLRPLRHPGRRRGSHRLHRRLGFTPGSTFPGRLTPDPASSPSPAWMHIPARDRTTALFSKGERQPGPAEGTLKIER